MAVGQFIAGVGALVRHPAQEKYLLLKRSPDKDFAPGIWECVTGRVDQGEGFGQAVLREAREELGCDVQTEFLIGTTHFYRGDATDANELVGLVYACSIEDPSAITLSDEHSEMRWVTAGEAEQLLSPLSDDSSRWTLRVVTRAEEIRRLLPDALLSLFQQSGFELG